MRIVVNINRSPKGNPHATAEVRTFYDTDPADDMSLHNAGIELYEIWTEAVAGAMKNVRIINEGQRK